MKDIIDGIRDLNLRMIERHQEETFRVDQLAVRMAEHGSQRNRTLEAVMQQQRRDLDVTRRLLHTIAVDAGMIPLPAPQHQHVLPPIEDEPMDLPTMIQRARFSADDAVNGVH